MESSTAADERYPARSEWVVSLTLGWLSFRGQ
jgi:hypothetical protein